MAGPSGDAANEHERRFDQARRNQIAVIRRLADTEDEMATTFDQLAGKGHHAQRRSELARQARRQAARLRSYADHLEES